MKNTGPSPFISSLLLSLALASISAGCATSLPYKTQQYAAHKTDRVFEQEMKVVYKAIEKAFEKQKFVSKNPKKVTPSELSQLTEATWETDWIYSQSRDKYVEYEVNSVPKRKPLQVRLKQKITAKHSIAGIQVFVETEEELERLKSDGTPNGYVEVEPDSSRAAEVLDRIQLSILSLGAGADMP
jgi:hypothetical protein